MKTRPERSTVAGERWQPKRSRNASAAAELVIDLLLLDELRGLRGERRPSSGEFFGEACDE